MKLIKTRSKYDMYSPEPLPLPAVLSLLPHNRAVPARGGWHRYEYDMIYSLNVAAEKHPESLDLLYFLFKGISTYTSFDNYPYLFLHKYALKKYPQLSQRKRLLCIDLFVQVFIGPEFNHCLTLSTD